MLLKIKKIHLRDMSIRFLKYKMLKYSNKTKVNVLTNTALQ